MKFIHISDLHFHRHPDDNRQATDLLRTIEKQYPEHSLIVTGDITDDGHELQFDRAREALMPFAGKIFIVPGNHDFGAAGNFYSRERAERFDRMLSEPFKQGGTFTGDQTPVVNTVAQGSDRVMLIALDTNLETGHPFDFACGQIGETQLAALDAILSAPSSSGMTKVLFFHHHPRTHNNPFMELKDARELMRTIYAKVDVMLFGHKHVSGRWEGMNGIKYVLASDDSPGKNWAREITIANGQINVDDISLTPSKQKKSGKTK